MDSRPNAGQANSMSLVALNAKQAKANFLPSIEAIEDVDESLKRFAGYMGECFEIQKKDLDLIKGTKFIQLRGQVIKQACLYFDVVAPKCVSVLTDLGNFFSEFNDFYDEYDSMKENLDLIHESSREISLSLIFLEQIHAPVYRETKANADKIEVVIQEISKVDDELRREYERIKAEQSELI